MSDEQTPIDVVCEALSHTMVNIQVFEVLVPEQCAMISINGEMYHVTVEKIDG